ncbi:MAG: glucose-6-phosphate dehydrogenase [Rhodobacteraceae bacterium]|nr:glucose-6-phosphate dehydrogenase [Paracoccaceae bacterium]
MFQIIPVDPFNLILFGGTGDLAKKEIFPSLFNRYLVGQMTSQSNIVGVARSPLSQNEFITIVLESIRNRHAGQEIDESKLTSFLSLVKYVQLDATQDTNWMNLYNQLNQDWLSVFYLSVGPNVFTALTRGLAKHGFVNNRSRIVVEKPFGHNLDSARQLNQLLGEVFEESQIYRIDHYLGKETVQNLMALRFANILFEPLWNCQYIDHVQITVAESIGVAGRGGYYDSSGAMRDMVQNHLMQLLCLVAMEPPSKFSPDAVRDEKLKVIRSLEVPKGGNVVRGQYGANGKIKSFLDDIENSQSLTESYVAMKCSLANWRWAGVPFYIRTGKRLTNRVTEIVVVFKDLPHLIFDSSETLKSNALVIRVQPKEGIIMRVTIKEPGPGGMRLVQVPLDMSFDKSLSSGEFGQLINAYERLIMDVIRGDQTLFMRGDEVEAAWDWTDKVIQNWEGNENRPILYKPATSGPTEAHHLIHADNRNWMKISK